MKGLNKYLVLLVLWTAFYLWFLHPQPQDRILAYTLTVFLLPVVLVTLLLFVFGLIGPAFIRNKIKKFDDWYFLNESLYMPINPAESLTQAIPEAFDSFWPSKERLKNFTMIMLAQFLIALVFTILVYLAALNFGQQLSQIRNTSINPQGLHNAAQQRPAGVINSIPSSNWKTFENNTYGYIFSYPTDWVITTKKENIVALDSAQTHQDRLKNPNEEYPGDVLVFIDLNPKNLSAQQYYDGNNAAQLFDNPGETKIIQIDGVKAFDTFPASGIGPTEDVVITRSGFFIHLESNNVGDETNTFHKILETFKLNTGTK